MKRSMNVFFLLNRFSYNKLSCLETSLFTSYSVDYRARNSPEKFWGFRETHARSENGYGFQRMSEGRQIWKIVYFGVKPHELNHVKGEL